MEENNDFLYKKVKNDIIRQINLGKYKQGQRIPTENELCEKHGVSRITVRRAINDLIRENILVTQRGRGTFVVKKNIDHVLLGGKSFSEICADNGKTVSSKLLQMSICRPSEKDIRFLQVREDELIFYIHRVRYADGIPVMIEKNYFPPQYLSLINYDLESRSLYHILRTDFGLRECISEETIEIARATQDEAAELNIKAGSPVLMTQEFVQDKATGAPVHRTKQIIVGEGWVYRLSSLPKNI